MLIHNETYGTTGGMEQQAAAMCSLAACLPPELFDACAYCLDAPNAMPAGGHFVYRRDIVPTGVAIFISREAA